ncbi:AAA family ATPase [Mycolicibacterium palauense]|uniref:AAA family ATPase n=1 Tax=Mycolicibacterium palauense TaxID=2034511 RepID=UPI001145E880|nr:AAA family ATPase [Mycolicibacterium palauense]
MSTDAVDELLDRAVHGPAALVVEGESGIGKTTLLLDALDRARARGFAVLSAHGVSPEVSLAFAAVSDLLDCVDAEVLASLPEPQRLALERARTGTADGPPTAERVTAAGFLTVLRILTASSPVLLAVDDAQWLDPATRAVLAYVGRRLTGKVAVLATVRTGEPDSAALSWLELPRPEMVVRDVLRPMSRGRLHSLISSRLGRALTKPEITRIHAVSGGNPFYALELARTADTADLPDTLAALVARRIRALDDDVLAVLLLVALAGDATTELLAEATGRPAPQILALLECAEEHGVVVIEGHHVRFDHPLLAAGVSANAGPAARRAAHQALAGAVTQPELQARHLALGSVAGDAATLAALDAAAVAAREQGAPASAAELVELAIGRGGDTPERRLLAAGHHFAAGATERARALLEPALAEIPAGMLRTQALILQASVNAYTGGFMAAEEGAREALADVRGNPAMEVGLRLMLAVAQMNDARNDEAEENLAVAGDCAEQLGIDSVTSQVLSLTIVLNFLRCRGSDPQARLRALELESGSPDVPIMLRATFNEAQLRAWEGDLDEAQRLIEQVRKTCLAWGAETDLLYITPCRMLIALFRGDLVEVAAVADEALERAEQLGGENALSNALTQQTLVAACAGRVEDARRSGAEALSAAERSGLWRSGKWPRMLLAFLEVSLGRHAEALHDLEPLIADFPADPCTEIVRAWYVPDAIEALIGVGRTAEARMFVDAMVADGERLDRPWIRMVGARGRSMLLAAESDLTGAERLAEQALAEAERVSMPFERARTLLLLGQLQRRRRRRGSAAATLAAAQREFERIGMVLWAQRARDELSRTAARSGTTAFGLTAAERRVAERAAAGLSNKEIAAELFIASKTVETNLSSAYRKLGIRSRAQLARRLRDVDAAGASA